MVLTLSIMLIIIAFSLYDYFSSRSWQMVTSRERNETVFENRNKEYGAYKIRRDYDKRILLVFLGVTVGIGGLWAASNLFRPIEQRKNVTVSTENITELFNDHDDEIVEIPEPEKAEAAAPSMQEIVAFREFVASDTETDLTINLVDDNTNVGLKDQTGDPEADPFDPTKIITKIGKVGDGIDKEPDNTIHTVLDEEARFPGGMDALRKFIADNIDLTSIEGSSKISLKFVVDTDGNISTVIVTRNTGDCNSCEKAAIKVVKSMPKWTPGKVNGEAVRSYYRLPINIQ
ncbi:Gram-negative bacterial tonB protein [compost metagenome]